MPERRLAGRLSALALLKLLSRTLEKRMVSPCNYFDLLWKPKR